MSQYSVPVTVTLHPPLPSNNTAPLPQSYYNISPDFSSLPASAMDKMDNKGHFRGNFTQVRGRITGVLQSGDQVAFNFSGADSLTTITNVTTPDNDVFVWNQRNGSSSTITGVVTSAANIINHDGNPEYNISLTYNGVAYTIDPDFETEVGDPTQP